MESHVIRKGYLPGRQWRIHYRAAGEHGPFVFLFHLTPFSSRQFEWCLPYFAPHARAYALDTPGYGQSDPPPGPTTIADYAGRLLAAIDSVTAGPVDLCGFSTGSVIALEIAARIPARVRRMVLSTTPMMSKAELAKMAAANVGIPAMAPDGAHLVTAWQGRQRIWGADLAPPILQAATADIIACYERHHWGLEAVKMCDIAELLRAVRCPTLFLGGALDPHNRHNEAAAALVPGARRALLPDARAPICATAPRAYAGRVLSFLRDGD